ncbi:hypothetical protein [Microbacterium sp. H1-D42]|uniref:hypothetical protein n=1 Tax=Microbacterium sp. H1-D42 TaxID=2925844 RepID=UPI001F5312BA|nr:hypothetical protein [Microbacterium sp. H1-D42]UNK71078.1 hypothetical protein MNR00_01135 [Microbacterium sp. H1-D42]
MTGEERFATAARAATDGRWLRPTVRSNAEPRWGHADGLQVGIHPIPGPRGLLRIFTSYLDHPRERLVNFIAVEPVPVGSDVRGYSELEESALDPGERGKRFWSGDRADDVLVPADPLAPARGMLEVIDGVEHLTVWIGVERFDNGADVRVRVRFRADRPHEVEVAGFANETSVPLQNLILTATMGNWARLRVLELADGTASPRGLWPEFSGTGFSRHARFDLSRLRREGDVAVVSAIGDEEDPWSATYADDMAEHWRFLGRRARQTWRIEDPHPDLEVLVNARWSYWASASEIPGGPAYENFEIVEPFRQGAAFRFAVDPLG